MALDESTNKYYALSLTGELAYLKVMSYFNRKSSKKIIMDLYSIYKDYNFENDVIYWSL